MIPIGMSVTVQGVGAGAVARWTRSSPGTEYVVQVTVDLPGEVTTSDSSYTVAGNLPRQNWSDPSVTVTAVDTNYRRFRVDSLAASFGLAGARGVFVGVSRAAAKLDMGPPPSAR